MNFIDATIVQLALPATRKGLFDASALGQILEAAYDVERIGPFAGALEPLFDEFELGVPAPPAASLEGSWNQVGSSDRFDSRFTLDGVGSAVARIDAFWRGAILARFTTASDTVETVSARWPDPSVIDAEVAAANGGALPAAALLEQGRRAVLLQHLKVGAEIPVAVTEAYLDALLVAAGVASVEELFESLSSTFQVAALQITYSAPTPVAANRRPLPIAAAILVRDVPLSLADLLIDAKVARRRLRALGYEAPADPSLAVRHPLVVIAVVPAAVFDDPDWPGANAAARRAGAGGWLAQEGIGLAVVGP